MTIRRVRKANDKPVRKIRAIKGWHNTIGHFPSLKSGEYLPFESRLESIVMYVLDWLVTVKSFKAQPIRHEYRWKHRKRYYVPDLQVFSLGGAEFYIEVKALALLDSEKFSFLQEEFKNHGWSLFLITDEMLFSGPFVPNVIRVSKFARYSVRPEVSEAFLPILSSYREPMPIMQLAEEIFPERPNKALISILNLIFHHRIATDMYSAYLDDKAFVWLPKEADTRKELSDVLPICSKSQV